MLRCCPEGEQVPRLTAGQKIGLGVTYIVFSSMFSGLDSQAAGSVSQMADTLSPTDSSLSPGSSTLHASFFFPRSLKPLCEAPALLGRSQWLCPSFIFKVEWCRGKGEAQSGKMRVPCGSSRNLTKK